MKKPEPGPGDPRIEELSAFFQLPDVEQDSLSTVMASSPDTGFLFFVISDIATGAYATVGPIRVRLPVVVEIATVHVGLSLRPGVGVESQ